jgi:hypothetical protein
MRIVLFVMTFVLASGLAPAQAQQVAFEVLGGADVATLPGFATAVEDPTLETGFRGGGTIGAGLDIPFSNFVSFRPSVMFVRKGLQLEGGEAEIPIGAHINLDYVEVPLLLMFTPNRSNQTVLPFVSAGGMFGFNTRAEMSGLIASDENEAVDINPDVRGWEGGVVASAGVIVKRFVGEVRFTQGLTSVVEEHRELTKDVQTRTISFLGGIRF